MNSSNRRQRLGRSTVVWKTLWLGVGLISSFSEPTRAAIDTLVGAGYSVGSPILKISTNGSNASDPVHVSLATVTNFYNPGADGLGWGAGAYDVVFGTIQVSAFMTAAANPSFGVPNVAREHVAEFHGQWQETVTLLAPGVPTNTPVLIHPVIGIQRIFTNYAMGTTPFPDGDASWSQPAYAITLNVENGEFLGATDLRQKNGSCFQSAAFASDPCPTNTVETWAADPITVRVGQPFDLYFQAQAAAGVRTPPSGKATAAVHAGTTIGWQGLAAVLATNQTVISNYTIIAPSGFNYGTKLQPTTNAPVVLNVKLLDPEQLTICWTGAALQLYRLESRATITSSWQTEGSLILGGGAEICVDQPIVGQQKYYRVVGVPNP